MQKTYKLTGRTVKVTEKPKNMAKSHPFWPITNAIKICRNKPCICGSGKKFKHCCLPTGHVKL